MMFDTQIETLPALLQLIGNTPLVKLDGPSRLTGCTILSKAEFLNPGGSVKDRTALGLVLAARRSGALKQGGTIVEGTAGNTGIGLAMVGAALGHKVIIVMPKSQSIEKKNLLLSHGCQVIEVDPAPYTSDAHFVHQSRHIAQALIEKGKAAWWANQFDNTDNRDFHAATTGREILDQSEGNIDGFICAVGTGGTLAGISSALKNHNPNIQIGLADPSGGALYDWVKHGVLKSEGSSITEGIGVGRVTGNIEGARIDHAYKIPDSELLPVLFDLVEQEGLSLGGSAGVNVAGAMRLARDLGPGKTIVTLLCDTGGRYAGKLYNKDFLQARGLPVPPWAASQEI